MTLTVLKPDCQRTMRLIDQTNAESYLRDAGRIDAGDRVEIARLAGGVSNEVLYVGFPGDPARDFVLKQARAQLRVADPWFCGVDRIWREVEVLRICESVLAARQQSGGGKSSLLARTPRILFEDREHYCFGMEAAPREHTVWKRRLLNCHSERSEESRATPRETLRFAQGDNDERSGDSGVPRDDNLRIAEQCGRLLGALHAGTWGDAEVAAALDDRRIFDELRLDPYYRTVARRHPDVAPALNQLVDSVWGHRFCLVHADFSPKNLLVYPGGLMMVDFETGHFGDPAFDLGFFLTHLMLKAYYHAPRHEPLLDLTNQFWDAYREALAPSVGHVSYVPESGPPRASQHDQRAGHVGAGHVGARHVGNVPHGELADLERRAVLNFAGCAWARLDGKSPVEYLTDAARRDQVRALCRWTLDQTPPRWDDVLAKCRSMLG